MNEQVIQTMFLLMRQVFAKAALTEEEKGRVPSELLPQLYEISKAHDMAHVVALALGELGLLGEDEISAKFQKQQMLAVYRYQQMQYELQQVSQVLEEAGIPFLPLKGSVIRAYYPEPWMRTSSDIDVLVHEEDLERAADLLKERLHYQEKKVGSHDVSLFSESGVNLELHYDLIEEARYPRFNKLLSSVWEYTEREEGSQSCHQLRWEMFYFYHVAHMVKHFEDGGCGIRAFLDIWILDHCVALDRAACDAFLADGGALRFTEVCRKVSEVWFGAGDHDAVSLQVQTYVLKGGVYGNLENSVVVRQNKKGGKIGYLFSRIFISRENLIYWYPILRKHKWLTPVMQVCRWFRILFKGKIKHSIREINLNRSVSQEQANSMGDLLKALGLDAK